MKIVTFFAIGLMMACNSSQKTVAEHAPAASPEASSVTYAESITEADLKEHLYTYASDEFEGRETGQPGQKKAVAYLKSQYEKLGIPSALAKGQYFQDVPLELSKLPTGSVSVDGKEFPIGEDLVAFSQVVGSFNEIVYVGYGIEEGDYSDYKGLDVEGKIILVKAGEPMNADGTYRLSGSNEKSGWSNMSESMGKRNDLANQKGVKAMLYFDGDNFKRYKGYYNYMKTNDSGRMGIKNPKKDPIVNLIIDAELARAILPEIEQENTPKLLVQTISLNLTGHNSSLKSENVAALLKGSEKPNEYLIISSHLDHIGITADGEINNGADDDGSGTVALLEIAEAFKKAADDGHGPKRSILFLHVTGEEKGLLGSQYYTDFDPIVPLEQTVADLNIDMIGRIDPKRQGDRNYIYLIGSDKLSSELHELSEDMNRKYSNLELDYTFNDKNDPNRFYYRSDHYNFAKNNIPIIFYFNGTHADYHKPGDTPDKINYDLLQNRTRLIFHTAWELANRDDRIIVDKAAK